jgi:hypothetical protein
MWDAGADGYAHDEGVATVVLKTLSAALCDGDHIECLIREKQVLCLTRFEILAPASASLAWFSLVLKAASSLSVANRPTV